MDTLGLQFIMYGCILYSCFEYVWIIATFGAYADSDYRDDFNLISIIFGPCYDLDKSYLDLFI